MYFRRYCKDLEIESIATTVFLKGPTKNVQEYFMNES